MRITAEASMRPVLLLLALAAATFAGAVRSGKERAVDDGDGDWSDPFEDSEFEEG